MTGREQETLGASGGQVGNDNLWKDGGLEELWPDLGPVWCHPARS